MAPHLTPGQLLAELLEKRGWTQAVLSVVLGINKATISQIVAGKRDLDAELALKLSSIFDVPPEQFMDLQKSYELARARVTWSPDPALARRAELFGSLPIAEMVKRSWLRVDDPKDMAKIEQAVIVFFRTDTVDDILTTAQPHAAKKTSVGAPTTPAQRAWLQRVREIAAEMVVPKFSLEALRAAIPKLAQLLSAAEEARHVPRILAEAGVRFVLVESLAGAKIDGACMWLDERSPVVGMSMRFDRLDNFWFVLRHELEHVLRGHGRADPMLDENLAERGAAAEDLPEEERQANEAAAAFCVPQKDLDSFIARKSPFFADRDLVGFAAKRQLHPSLVAGQIRHRVKRWDLFAKHNVKVRFAVAPGAMVDGWGDVAPVQRSM